MSDNTQHETSNISPLEVTRNMPDELNGLTLGLEHSSHVTDERYLLSFDHDGMQSIDPIPANACVMSHKQMLAAINEPNGLYIDTETLAAFAIGTIKRLKARHAFYATNGAPMLRGTTTKAMADLVKAVSL